MSTTGKDATGADTVDGVLHGRHQDPIQGRLSIRRWYDLSSHLPGELASRAVKGLDTRRFIEAVLWMAATDSTWPELPHCYGNFHVVYQRFARWTRLDVWDFVCTRLHGDPRLPALQRMVHQERTIQQRRDALPAQAMQGADDLTPAWREHLCNMEARIEGIEAQLRSLLDALPPSAGVTTTRPSGTDAT